ncbi:MAG: septum formation initiator family protein [Candidatus Poribacteria bacterium]|nr:septum formation initiator family protein [Candidatus Poribacteria bacterium]
MRILRAILLIIALALLIVSVRQFMRGYKDWQQAQIDEKGYQAEIQELQTERDQRKQRVELLKNDTLTKERLVRKRFGYVKPGEVKYKIVQPKQSE